jgi:hypothetical protein
VCVRERRKERERENGAKMKRYYMIYLFIFYITYVKKK